MFFETGKMEEKKITSWGWAGPSSNYSIVVIVVEVVVKAMVEIKDQLLLRMGGWSDKTKLIIISTLDEVVAEVEVELCNIKSSFGYIILFSYFE